MVAYDSDKPMKAFFVVSGPMIWLDENGEGGGHFDVHDYIALARGHDALNGVGEGYVDTLFR